MTCYRPSERRWTSLLGVVAVHAALAALLLTGLAPRLARVSDTALATFDVVPPPPPPALPTPPAVAPAPAAQGRAAPANRRATPAPVAAPVPIVPPPLPAPTTTPLVPATGAASEAGAAVMPGPGPGAGGRGDGLGSGAAGDGSGGGGSGARLVAGRIGDRDYPREARRDRLGGTVTVRFTVGTDGHAHGCTIMRSSGVASLDATTCALIEARFRYTPAHDAAGRAVAEERGWRQTWWLEGAGARPDAAAAR